MVSEANIKEIERNGFDYILGVRMRNAKHIGNKLLVDKSTLSKLKEKLQKGPKQLVGNRGYARFLILNCLEKMWPYPTKGSGKLNVVSGISKALLR